MRWKRKDSFQLSSFLLLRPSSFHFSLYKTIRNRFGQFIALLLLLSDNKAQTGGVPKENAMLRLFVGVLCTVTMYPLVVPVEVNRQE